MSKRKVLEVLLDSVELREQGEGRKSAGHHVVLARLVWPRPGIAEKISISTVSITGGFTDLADAEWVDRILLKEVVEGTIGIEMAVSRKVSLGKANDFAASMGESMFKAGGKVVEDMGLSLGRVPFEYLAKQLSGSKKSSPGILASGKMELSRAGGLKQDKMVQVKIPLSAPQAITRIEQTRRRGELATRRRTLLKKGEGNGVVVLSVALRG